MTTLAFRIFECLLAHTTEACEYRPRHEGLRNIGLVLASQDTAPAARDLFHACFSYWHYWRGAAQALRADKLSADQRYSLKRDLLALLVKLERARGALREQSAEPTTPWVRALLALPAGMDGHIRRELVRGPLRERAARHQRDGRVLTFTVEIEESYWDFDLTIHLTEDNLVYAEKAGLATAQASAPTLSDELDRIIRLRRDGIDRIDQVMAAYKTGDIFPSAMRERQDQADAAALARKLVRGLSARDKALLKGRVHLLSELL